MNQSQADIKAIKPTGGRQRLVTLSREAQQVMSLKSRALGSTAWTLASFGLCRVLRLGGNIVLARLLFPEAFGLMVLVRVILAGLELLSDMGVGLAIIQHRRGDERVFLNTAWTIQVIRGAGLWLCACLIAWPAAWAFSRNDPMAKQLIVLIPVAALAALFGGFNATTLFTLKRRLQFRPLVALEITATLCAISVMIPLALLTRSVWALVAGSLTMSIVRLLISHRLSGGSHNRFCWDHDCVKALFVFGKWIILSTAIMFLSQQGDRLILGNLVTLDVLGVYGLGFMFASLPRELFTRLTSAILFPTLSELGRTNPRSLPKKVRLSRSVILLVAIPAIVGVVLLAPAFFAVLYDSRYHAAGFFAQLIAIQVWLRILFDTSTRSLLATGNTASLAAGNTAQFVVAIPSCLLGIWLLGIPGFILGYSLGTVAGLIVIENLMSRADMFVFDQDIKYSLACFVLAAVGLGLSSVSAILLPQMNPAVLQVAAAAFVLVPYSLWAGRRLIRVLRP